MIKKAWTAYAALLTAAVVIGEATNLAQGGTIDARTFARVYRSRASRALSWVWVVGAGLALAGAASLHPSVRDFVTDLVAR